MATRSDRVVMSPQSGAALLQDMPFAPSGEGGSLTVKGCVTDKSFR